MTLPPGTRLYTDSSENLILRFYTGMPFQNIMPVRKAFLDGHDGELLIMESSPFELLREPLAGQILRRRAAISIDRPDAFVRQVTASLVAEQLNPRVARVSFAAGPPPADIRPLIDYQRDLTAAVVMESVALSGNPMFHGYTIRDFRQM